MSIMCNCSLLHTTAWKREILCSTAYIHLLLLVLHITTYYCILLHITIEYSLVHATACYFNLPLLYFTVLYTYSMLEWLYTTVTTASHYRILQCATICYYCSTTTRRIVLPITTTRFLPHPYTTRHRCRCIALIYVIVCCYFM